MTHAWALPLALLVACSVGSGPGEGDPPVATDNSPGAAAGPHGAAPRTPADKGPPPATPLTDAGAPLPDASKPPPPPPPPPPPALPTKKTLNVQWQGQQTYYFCGPGSTRMALSTRMANPPDQFTLGNFMGTTTNGTDYIGLVVGALNHYLGIANYRTTDLPDPPSQAQRDALKADILNTIGKHDSPMVANVVSGWRPPGYPGGTIYHYVAVVGYDSNGDSAEIADPAGAGAGGSSWGAVPKTYFISTQDLGTWIGGKGYASF